MAKKKSWQQKMKDRQETLEGEVKELKELLDEHDNHHHKLVMLRDETIQQKEDTIKELTDQLIYKSDQLESARIELESALAKNIKLESGLKQVKQNFKELLKVNQAIDEKHSALKGQIDELQVNLRYTNAKHDGVVEGLERALEVQTQVRANLQLLPE